MLKFQGEPAKLFDAIGKAMKSMRPLPRTSTGKLTASQSFKYAPLRKVVECIKDDLHNQGVSFMQALHTDGQYAAVTLIVAGHEASITSTFAFDRNPDAKKFGADSTYYRRYQLGSFFGLEGDPDADDFEDPVPEPEKAPVEKQVAKDAVPAAKSVAVQESSKSASENKPVEKTKEIPYYAPVTKSVNDALINAMKQLNWTMENMNEFCRSRTDLFPNFVKATALSESSKATLLVTLNNQFELAPF
jgi:hypothetical protein